MGNPAAHSPGFRNLVHAGVFFIVGLPMLALVRFNSEYHWVANLDLCILGFLAIGTLFNVCILRYIPGLNRVLRGTETRVNGIWLYPFMLLVCFAIFPYYAAFGAWAVMACGDAPASFFGRRIPYLRLPWNKKKTVAGVLAFALFAMGAVYISLYFMPCPLFLKKDGSPELPYVWTFAALAALSGALIESIETAIDDNIRVPICAGTTLVAAAHFLKFSTLHLPETTHVQPHRLVHALIANALLGVAVMLLRFADLTATLVGMALGILIYFYAGWQGYVIFGIFVGMGSALSRMGIERKIENHTAEANKGKRGISNVVANLLVPALCCAAYPLLGGRPSLLMAFAGSIAAAMADTASSEIGVLSPNEPWLITTFKTVPHGTNGAVSLLGMSGAVAASAVIATAAYGTGFFPLAFGAGARLTPWILTGAWMTIFASGMVGTMMDSLLGATLEDRVKFIGKGAVNFACTLTGAATAGLMMEAWGYISVK